EIALHVNPAYPDLSSGACAAWTPSTLRSFYNDQVLNFRSLFPSLPSPTTNRTHCVAWGDWSNQPETELNNGIRLDTTYYAYPFTIDALLDNATGPNGYYGAFTVNAHVDVDISDVSNAVVASAQARGVSIVSARQMLQWLDGRNASSFGAMTSNGNALSFTIS